MTIYYLSEAVRILDAEDARQAGHPDIFSALSEEPVEGYAEAADYVDNRVRLYHLAGADMTPLNLLDTPQEQAHWLLDNGYRDYGQIPPGLAEWYKTEGYK
jgi:hypothetical protein